MKFSENNGLLLGQFERIAADWPIRHVLSTRIGGVSLPPFASLNVALHVGDETHKVIENRRRVCHTINAPTERFVALRQPHLANVFVLKSFSGKGGFHDWNRAEDNVDAVVTNLPNVTLFVLAADCALTLFFDPIRKVLALAHSGWRGAILNIYRNLVEVMRLEYGSKIQDIYVGISPLVCSKDFQINTNIVQKAQSMYTKEEVDTFLVRKGDEYTLDIMTLLRLQLTDLGIEHVEAAGICTAEKTDLFYSHEKEAKPTGRFGLFAYLL